MKIRFQLPATVATWWDQTPSDEYSTAHYSRSWLLRVGTKEYGKLIGWVDLHKPHHVPTAHPNRPYRWSMDALLERDEPAGWVATLEEAQAEILKRLGTVETL
jgi:hypothetical protein